MKRHAIFIILFFLFSLSIFGFGKNEQPLAIDSFPQAVGGFYGPVGGWGLSYQKWMDTIGIQTAAGGYYYYPNNSSGLFSNDVLNYSVGIELQKLFIAEDIASWFGSGLYGFAGLGHSGEIPLIIDQIDSGMDDPDGYPIYNYNYSLGTYLPSVSAGVGIGIEIVFFRHFSIINQVGYQLKYTYESGKTAEESFIVDFMWEGGLRYRF